MATTNFEHPHIDWDSADLYKEFERFQNHVSFVFAGPLATQTPRQKAGWLGTWIGEQGREVYKTLQWEDGEKDDPDRVLAKFASYIRPRKNKRIAHHRFKKRCQSSEEAFDHYVKDLRILLMDCEYTDPDDMLLDQIIDGVKATKVQERLLDRGEDLTLAKALEIAQQFELSQQQLKIVRDEDTKVSAVSTRPKHSSCNIRNRLQKPQAKSLAGSVRKTSMERHSGQNPPSMERHLGPQE